jgi:ankyrin repeat protein/uncharacterized glyoxalase superfamily protein PhnB
VSQRLFFDACARGDAEQLRELLASDSGLVRATDPAAHHPGWTGLHTAAREGRTEAVRVLLAHGADPDAREAGDNTCPLHWAAAHLHLDMVRTLLDAGGDVHGIGDVHELDVIGWATVFHPPGRDPAEFAAQRREVASLLVERGARHHIFSAIAMGDPDLIRRVVEQNPAALDRRLSRFERRQTPLHFALERKRHDLLDLLIGLGAALEATDAGGQTALAVAMLRGDHDAMRRLHAAGAKPPAAMAATDLKAGMAGLARSVGKGVPMIFVPDVARALDWYASIGFTEIARYADDGLVNFGMVSFGGAEIMINMHGKAGRHDVTLWFYTDRVDDLYRLLKARQLDAARAAIAGGPAGNGIDFEQDIEDMFYGARQFGIRDLNGYILYFIQSVEP